MVMIDDEDEDDKTDVDIESDTALGECSENAARALSDAKDDAT